MGTDKDTTAATNAKNKTDEQRSVDEKTALVQERQSKKTPAQRAAEGATSPIDPMTGEPYNYEPDETGSTSGIPPVGPTDMDGDGEPDAGVEEQEQIRQRYQDTVDAESDAEAARREAKGLPAQGPEQKRRANSLAEALYPNEDVSDEAKDAVAPKADAAHA